jgi:hypothetical protein
MECVTGESDDWHWYAESSTGVTNSIPDCEIPPTTGGSCAYEGMAWDSVTLKYQTGVMNLCSGPDLSYVCTESTGGVIAGLPYNFRKRYDLTFGQGSPSNCSTITTTYANSHASRTPSCPADFSLVDNRGP